MDFEEHKRKSMNSLAVAVEKNEVDEKILPLLELINSTTSFFTTSSCSGRISLSCVPLRGKKKDHVFIAKWHRKVEVEEVMEKVKMATASGMYGGAVLWLKCESFILHVGCRSVRDAGELIKLCVELGFKRSGIFRLEPFPFVEIIATDYIATPLGIDNRPKVDEDYIKFVVDVMNVRMEENDRKLKKLEEEFSRRFCQ